MNEVDSSFSSLGACYEEDGQGRFLKVRLFPSPCYLEKFSLFKNGPSSTAIDTFYDTPHCEYGRRGEYVRVREETGKAAAVSQFTMDDNHHREIACKALPVDATVQLVQYEFVRTYLSAVTKLAISVDGQPFPFEAYLDTISVPLRYRVISCRFTFPPNCNDNNMLKQWADEVMRVLHHQTVIPVMLSKFMFSLVTSARTELYHEVFAAKDIGGDKMSAAVDTIMDSVQQDVDGMMDYIWLCDTAFSSFGLFYSNHKGNVDRLYELLNEERAANRGVVCRRDMEEYW